MRKIAALVFLCLCLLPSCGIQKRLYNKGFYFGEHTTAKQTKADSITVLVNSIKQPVKQKPATLLAQLTKTKTPAPKIKVVATEGCDTIYLKNGTTYIGKVIGNRREISFLPCPATIEKQEIVRVKRRDISSIHYAAGLIEPVASAKKHIELLAGLGVFLSILSICCALLSISFSAAWLVGLFEILAVAFAVIGFALSLFALTRKKHADNPRLVTALALVDFILSVPLALLVLALLLTLH